jgi:hypothetical protein
MSTAATMLRLARLRTSARYPRTSLALNVWAKRMASTSSANAWGLKDPSLAKFQGVIGGAWVDAKSAATISVQSMCQRSRAFELG